MCNKKRSLISSLITIAILFIATTTHAKKCGHFDPDIIKLLRSAKSKIAAKSKGFLGKASRHYLREGSRTYIANLIKRCKPKCSNELKAKVAGTLSPTVPSLPKFSKIKGEHESLDGLETDSPQFNDLKAQNKSADILARAGYDIISDPKSNNLSKSMVKDTRKIQYKENLLVTKQPDYIIEGKIFDHLNGKSEHPGALAKNIIKKATAKQTHRVIVSLLKNDNKANKIYFKNLKEELRKQSNNGGDEDMLYEVIVITGRESRPIITPIFP